MFDRLISGNAMPALERALQFASARHRLIANNIANVETPGYRPTDVSVEGFQSLLRDAIDARQAAASSGVGAAAADGTGAALDGTLAMPSSDEVVATSEGIELQPTPIGEGILYHDGNDRSVERILQSLTENLIQFRFAATMIRRQFATLDAAIRERP